MQAKCYHKEMCFEAFLVDHIIEIIIIKPVLKIKGAEAMTQ